MQLNKSPNWKQANVHQHVNWINRGIALQWTKIQQWGSKRLVQATVRINFTDTELSREKPDAKEHTLLGCIHATAPAKTTEPSDGEELRACSCLGGGWGLTGRGKREECGEWWEGLFRNHCACGYMCLWKHQSKPKLALKMGAFYCI